MPAVVDAALFGGRSASVGICMAPDKVAWFKPRYRHIYKAIGVFTGKWFIALPDADLEQHVTPFF